MKPPLSPRHHRWVGLVVVAAIAVIALVTGCPPGDDRPDVALPGSGTETAWWAALSTVTTPTPPSTPGSGDPANGEPRRGEQSVAVTLTAPSDVLFEEGSATLTASAAPIIDAIAADLDHVVAAVHVTGSTDHLGSHHANMALGAARAEAVTAALNAHGINPDTLVPHSVGETAPVCAEVRPDGSDDADCRARNRRVTITYTQVEAGQ